ncbi:MAG TPA: ornithine cyclodeaminase family protein [Longimicrobiaceae bacterium]|nr:ornithine cyclodeaminase family protein [Longimicrobiaceae bacterium]
METLILNHSDVAALLPLRDCIAAVEQAFRLLGEGRAGAPETLSVHADGGGFHVKAGILELGGRRYFAAKTNGNFPGNPARHGLPTIQGVVVLCDADDGRVLAVMDSVEITARRTAAATAVAARFLAPPEASVVTVCGCGVQGREQLRALTEVLPLRRVYACDVLAERVRAYAEEMSAELGLEVVPEPDLGRAVGRSEVVVLCTTSTEFLLYPEQVPAGSFVAGVGVDNETKRELAPALLASAKVVTDIRAQCARIGDLHHAVEAGVLDPADVHADLAEVVAGVRPGRETPGEVIVFDSTGMALQDVAAAAAVYERCLEPTAGGLRSVVFA